LFGNGFCGAVCKNVLFSVGNGIKLIAGLDDSGQVLVGTLLNASERDTDLAVADLDVAVLLGGYNESRFIAYSRGVAMINIATTSVPTLRPFLGGSLMTGYGNATPAGTSNPISPQIRAVSSSNVNPSMLFGGPLGRGSSFLGSVPGARQQSTPNPNGMVSPSYICVEWME
jgi:hypothetical protein